MPLKWAIELPVIILLLLSRSENPNCPFGGTLEHGQHLNSDTCQSNIFAHFVKSVVVADRAAPSDVVKTVTEMVGVLVVLSLLQALGGDLDIVVGRSHMPRENNATVAFPEVGKDFLALAVRRVKIGGYCLQAGRCLSCDFHGSSVNGDSVSIEGCRVPQFPRLLDDSTGR